MRAPECGFSAAKCRDGANSCQPITSTPSPPSHYPIGRIRKETIKEAAEAGELPDDEHVARSARAHAAVESRAVVAGTGRDVVVDVDGVDARGLQRIARQVQRLGAVRLGDAGVADPPVSQTVVCDRRAPATGPAWARARGRRRAPTSRSQSSMIVSTSNPATPNAVRIWHWLFLFSCL